MASIVGELFRSDCFDPLATWWHIFHPTKVGYPTFVGYPTIEVGLPPGCWSHDMINISSANENLLYKAILQCFCKDWADWNSTLLQPENVSQIWQTFIFCCQICCRPPKMEDILHKWIKLHGFVQLWKTPHKSECSLSYLTDCKPMQPIMEAVIHK